MSDVFSFFKYIFLTKNLFYSRAQSATEFLIISKKVAIA